MKNAVKEILIGVLCFSAFVMFLAVPSVITSRYSTTAIVFEVTADGTTFVDGAGYMWEVTDTDFEKDQFVTLKFFNNHTDSTREDDEILRVIK